MAAKAKNSLDRLFRRILSAKLWILDDWGVVAMRPEVAEEVFDLLDRRIGSNALSFSHRIVTSTNGHKYFLSQSSLRRLSTGYSTTLT